jgi:hypothetical protein
MVAPQAACACSCALSSKEEFTANADLIFVGVVTAIDKPFAMGGEVKVDFLVEDVDKGDSAGDITLTTASDGAACGYDFSVGHRFRVYAREGSTGLCSGNELLGSAPEVPVDKAFAVIPVTIGGGVLVAGLIAFVLHRRRVL